MLNIVRAGKTHTIANVNFRNDRIEFAKLALIRTLMRLKIDIYINNLINNLNSVLWRACRRFMMSALVCTHRIPRHRRWSKSQREQQSDWNNSGSNVR